MGSGLGLGVGVFGGGSATIRHSSHIFPTINRGREIERPGVGVLTGSGVGSRGGSGVGSGLGEGVGEGDGVGSGCHAS